MIEDHRGIKWSMYYDSNTNKCIIARWKQGKMVRAKFSPADFKRLAVQANQTVKESQESKK